MSHELDRAIELFASEFSDITTQQDLTRYQRLRDVLSEGKAQHRRKAAKLRSESEEEERRAASIEAFEAILDNAWKATQE